MIRLPAWIFLLAGLIAMNATTSAHAATTTCGESWSQVWSHNLRHQEVVALTGKQPVVVAFIGNGQFDPKFFRTEPADHLGAKAQFTWVGASPTGAATTDQIALEKQFNVSNSLLYFCSAPS